MGGWPGRGGRWRARSNDHLSPSTLRVSGWGLPSSPAPLPAAISLAEEPAPSHTQPAPEPREPRRTSSPGRGLRAPSSPLPRSVPSPGARCENRQQQPRTPGVLQPTGAGYGGPPPGQGWGPPKDRGREANVSRGGRVGEVGILLCSVLSVGFAPNPSEAPHAPLLGQEVLLEEGVHWQQGALQKGVPSPPLSVPLGPGAPYTHVWVVPAPAREGGV